MTAAELTIARPARGRPSVKEATIEFVRDLRPADVALMAAKPPAVGETVNRLKTIRDRHHGLARVIAQGYSDEDASAVTGFSPVTIRLLKSDPLFSELVAHYRSVEDALAADYMERMTTLGLTAMSRLQEAMEDEEKPPSESMALEVAKFASDRAGYGPTQKNVNVNVNTNLGDRLKAARERARLAAGKPPADALEA